VCKKSGVFGYYIVKEKAMQEVSSKKCGGFMQKKEKPSIKPQ